MAWTGTNPVGAVGDPTEKGDLDVLRDNNDWLRTQFLVGHTFPGTGGRAGRHYGLSKYSGSGSIAANSAETAILTQVDADFATGLWEVVILLDGINVGQWYVSGTRLGSYVSYQSYRIGTSAEWNLTGIDVYPTVAPAVPYSKCDFNAGTNTLTLSVKPTAGAAMTWAYVIWRESQ